jgi:hypothetical protein
MLAIALGCAANWGHESRRADVQNVSTSRSASGSHQKLRCSFQPDSGAAPENYVGHINRLGIDIGVKAGGVMAWSVFAPTNGHHHGALAGKYVGGSGSASLGVGVGANALIGGSHRSISVSCRLNNSKNASNIAVGEHRCLWHRHDLS